MSLHLYNSLSRSVERFKPLKQDEVKVYYCGPTPYNYAHIGNLRAYLFEDFVIRTLRFLGYKVKTVMNITDIDDKTIRDSQKSGKTLQEFTEFYAEAFLADLERLHIHRADTVAPISTLIPEMGTMIQGLIDKGYAYLADDGSVYYSVSKFKKYGELAHLDMSGMISSVRIDNDEYDKEQVADFALWKAYDKETDGENFWEIEIQIPNEKGKKEGNGGSGVETVGEGGGEVQSGKETSFSTTDGFGTFATKSTEDGVGKIKLKGRPGWHIECSACNYRFFGEQIDIHMGGIDNLFPHHQNEVAQTEAFTGKQFSKYWMHGGHLLVDNKKMAKSAGNFYTLRDIIDKIQGGNRKTEEHKEIGVRGEGTVGAEMREVVPMSNASIERVGLPTETFDTFGHKSMDTLPSEKVQQISEELICRGFRLMALQNQYRENFNFTFERLGAAINTIKGLDEMIKRLGRYGEKLDSGDGERSARGQLKKHDISREFRDNQQYFVQEFVEKLEDDFDTNSAMTLVFEYQSYINTGIDESLFSYEETKSLIDLLKSWQEVVGIFDFLLLESSDVPEDIRALAESRQEAKKNKNWTEADKIRDMLADLGWKMIDEKDGWRVEKI